MISNKSIVLGILVKSKVGYFFGNEYPEDRFYILTEIKTIDGYDHEYDMLVLYGLTEEQFVSVSRWHFDESIGNGVANIVV